MGLKLSQHFELVYVHGAHRSDTASPGLEFFSDGPWYKWRDDDDDYDASLQHLANYCKANGSVFDGVYAFSDGARIVTTLSQSYAKFGLKRCPWNFAILACGYSNFALAESPPLEFPAFFIHGAKDSVVGQVNILEKCWVDPISYTHQGGHEITANIVHREPELGSRLEEFLKKQRQHV